MPASGFISDNIVGALGPVGLPLDPHIAPSKSLSVGISKGLLKYSESIMFNTFSNDSLFFFEFVPPGNMSEPKLFKTVQRFLPKLSKDPDNLL